MPKIFSDQDKIQVKKQLLQEGFEMLKEKGLAGVRVEDLTKKCFIAKGTFYSFFPTKSEFIYQMMLDQRSRTKRALIDHLDNNGKLSATSLYHFLHWMCRENPNVFAYIKEEEQKRLMKEWPPDYIKNEHNDVTTMQMLCSLLQNPKKDLDWKNACNFMKLMAISLAVPHLFISDAFESSLDMLIRQTIACLTDQSII